MQQICWIPISESCICDISPHGFSKYGTSSSCAEERPMKDKPTIIVATQMACLKGMVRMRQNSMYSTWDSSSAVSLHRETHKVYREYMARPTRFSADYLMQGKALELVM
jgi:hypothetical protein